MSGEHRPAIGLSSAGRHTLCMECGEPWPCRSEAAQAQGAAPRAERLDVHRLAKRLYQVWQRNMLVSTGWDDVPDDVKQAWEAVARSASAPQPWYAENTDYLCFGGLSPEAAAERGIKPHVVCPDSTAHEGAAPRAEAWERYNALHDLTFGEFPTFEQFTAIEAAAPSAPRAPDGDAQRRCWTIQGPNPISQCVFYNGHEGEHAFREPPHPHPRDCRDGHDFRLTTDFDGEPVRCMRCKCLPEAAR